MKTKFADNFRVSHKISSEKNVVRYTRFVKLLKLLLPTIASVLVAMILIWPQIVSEKDRFKINIGTPVFSRAEKMRMINAKFFATDEKNQPYSLSADLAMETEAGSMIIELTEPKADIMLANNSWIATEARKGIFSQKEEVLNLLNKVSIFHDNGSQFETDNIVINLKKGEAFADSKVTITAPFGTMEGKGILVTDKGEKIKLIGNAKVVLYYMPKEAL